MLTDDKLDGLRGARIVDAELREDQGKQTIRLRLDIAGDRCVLEIRPDGDGLDTADVTSLA